MANDAMGYPTDSHALDSSAGKAFDPGKSNLRNGQTIRSHCRSGDVDENIRKSRTAIQKEVLFSESGRQADDPREFLC
jgi:hypothetical protein